MNNAFGPCGVSNVFYCRTIFIIRIQTDNQKKGYTMNHQEITNGNRLINDLMGSTIKIHQDDVKDIPLAFLKLEDMKFHLSWKWLMPVVIRVEEEEGCRVRIEGAACTVFVDGEPVIEQRADAKMEAVWKAIVAYLESGK